MNFCEKRKNGWVRIWTPQNERKFPKWHNTSNVLLLRIVREDCLIDIFLSFIPPPRTSSCFDISIPIPCSRGHWSLAFRCTLVDAIVEGLPLLVRCIRIPQPDICFLALSASIRFLDRESFVRDLIAAGYFESVVSIVSSPNVLDVHVAHAALVCFSRLAEYRLLLFICTLDWIFLSLFLFSWSNRSLIICFVNGRPVLLHRF